MSVRETQFTSAIDLLKAVTVVILGFLMRREKMMYFNLSGQEITQHGKELQGILL